MVIVMWIVKNVSRKVIPLVDTSQGIISQLDLLPGEELSIEDLSFILNLLPLLDPSLNLIQIREDV